MGGGGRIAGRTRVVVCVWLEFGSSEFFGVKDLLFLRSVYRRTRRFWNYRGRFFFEFAEG